MRRFSLRTILLCTVLVSLLTACGGGGGSAPVTLPSRTGTGLPSRTATGVPTPDRSTPTVPPTGQPTNQPTNQPTDRPTNQPTNQPTNRPTNQPTNQPTTQATIQPTTQATIQPSTGGTSAPPSASSSPEPAEADQDQGSDDISPWWWVALAVVLLGGAVVAWLLIRRSRRRRAWLADLAAAEAEVGWFARDLVPQLRGSGSVEGVAGGWTVAAPRVTALDDRLTELVTTAPGTEERARAATFQDAVRAAREGVAGLVAAGGTDTWSRDLDAAQAPLLAALVPPASASEQGPGSPPGH